jgi:hypothetical protein
MALESTQPLTEMSRADNPSTFMCGLSWNVGISTSWNPQGLARPVMGLLLSNMARTSSGLQWIGCCTFVSRRRRWPDQLSWCQFLMDDVYTVGRMHVHYFNTTYHARLLDVCEIIGQTVLIVLLFRSAVCATVTSFFVWPTDRPTDRPSVSFDEPGKEITFPTFCLSHTRPSKQVTGPRNKLVQKCSPFFSGTTYKKKVQLSSSLPF